MSPAAAWKGEPERVALAREPTGPRSRNRAEVESDYPLRPRTAPQLLDLGIEVLAERFLACVGVCVVLWIPLRVLVSFLVTSPWMDPDSTITVLESPLGFFVAITILQGLTEIVATTAVTLLSYEELIGRRMSLREMCWRTLRRLPALVVIFAMTTLILWVAALCPIFLAAFVLVRWKLSVAPSALVLEDLSLGRALRRSSELTRGSFLRFLGVWVLAWLLGFGFTSGTQVGDNPFLREAFLEAVPVSPDAFEALFVLVSSLFAGIATAISAVAFTSYYLDARIRREGLDLWMTLERMDEGRAPAREHAR